MTRYFPDANFLSSLSMDPDVGPSCTSSSMPEIVTPSHENDTSSGEVAAAATTGAS